MTMQPAQSLKSLMEAMSKVKTNRELVGAIKA